MRQRQPAALARPQGGAARQRGAARREGQFHLGPEKERLAAVLEHPAQPAPPVQFRHGARVVRAGLVQRLQLDLALDALGDAQQLALGFQRAGVGAVQRHQVGDAHLAGGGGEQRLQHVRAVQVAPLGPERRGGAQREPPAAPPVQHRGEHRGAGDARQAQPVHRSLARDQRHRPAIAHGGVGADRRVALGIIGGLKPRVRLRLRRRQGCTQRQAFPVAGETSCGALTPALSRKRERERRPPSPSPASGRGPG